MRDEATVIRQTRENYKEARANIEEKLKVLAEREQTKSVIWQKQYQEALKSQLDTAIDTLSKKNYSNIHQYLEGEYENGFIGTMYSLQKQGIPLVMPIDQTRVVKMVETGADGIKLSKRMYGNTTKLKNAVRREVSIGFASGESYQQVAGRLSRTMGVDYNKTIRIARTEGGRVANASRYDASVQAKKSGADIVKQWDSTLDNRTRTAHRELDGQVRELEDYFEAEGQKAKHPHGFGVPWMDINCRCVMLQRARWAVEGEGYEDYTKYSRFADFERDKWLDGSLDKTVRKHGGDTIDLSDAKNFADFKQRYKKAASNVAAQNAAKAIGVSTMGEPSTAKNLLGLDDETYSMYKDILEMTDAEILEMFGYEGVSAASKVSKYAGRYEAAKNRDEASKVLSRFTKNQAIYDDDIPKALCNEFNEALSQVAERFNVPIDIVRVKKASRDVQGAYDASTRTMKIKKQTEKYLEKNYASGWNASKHKYATYYHEIGHAVYKDLPSAKKSEAKSIFEDVRHKAFEEWKARGGSRSRQTQAEVFKEISGVSRYAHTDHEEFFSECLSQIMSGHPSEYAKKIERLLM